LLPVEGLDITGPPTLGTDQGTGRRPHGLSHTRCQDSGRSTTWGRPGRTRRSRSGDVCGTRSTSVHRQALGGSPRWRGRNRCARPDLFPFRQGIRHVVEHQLELAVVGKRPTGKLRGHIPTVWQLCVACDQHVLAGFQHPPRPARAVTLSVGVGWVVRTPSLPLHRAVRADPLPVFAFGDDLNSADHQESPPAGTSHVRRTIRHFNRVHVGRSQFSRWAKQRRFMASGSFRSRSPGSTCVRHHHSSVMSSSRYTSKPASRRASNTAVAASAASPTVSTNGATACATTCSSVICSSLTGGPPIWQQRPKRHGPSRTTGAEHSALAVPSPSPPLALSATVVEAHR